MATLETKKKPIPVVEVKSKDEMWGEVLFRQLPRNTDGTKRLFPSDRRPIEGGEIETLENGMKGEK